MSVRIINWDILVKNIRAYYLVSTISFRLSLSLSVALSCCLALFSQLNTASTPSTTVSVLLYTFRKLLSTMVLSVVCKLQSQFSNHIAPLLTTKLVHKESAVVVLCYYIKPVQFLQEWCHMIVFGLSKNKLLFFAALFWTLCKREICFKGNPARMELQ